ncbi:hypothetical protein SAMN05443252_107238 [Bacillus sp. OV322]|uniref:hypothetical protein n=1 Tax=Bacillus sp. OV322 TaxID=1882764 RepID=UPI0008EC16EB|nr:hypothetical protein [Bacillus sp. OV322]SFC88295.1 hypothetical protein SAMN05443252_107238 [Bacillus sp. OV322]
MGKNSKKKKQKNIVRYSHVKDHEIIKMGGFNIAIDTKEEAGKTVPIHGEETTICIAQIAGTKKWSLWEEAAGRQFLSTERYESKEAAQKAAETMVNQSREIYEHIIKSVEG